MRYVFDGPEVADAQTGEGVRFHSARLWLVRIQTDEPGPDDFRCRRCGELVRYARVGGNKRINTSFDAKPIPMGGYTLTEEVVDGLPTGDWIATYTRIADRQEGHMGHRQHDCPAKRHE